MATVPIPKLRRYGVLPSDEDPYFDGSDDTSALASPPPLASMARDTAPPKPPAATVPPPGTLPTIPGAAPPPPPGTGPLSPALDFGGIRRGPPPNSVAAPSSDAGESTPTRVAKELEALGPAPGTPGSKSQPKSNIFQTIAQTILGATRLGPEGAALITHPKFSAQVGRYQAQLADIAAREKLQEGAEELASKQQQRQEREQTAKERAAAYTTGQQSKQDAIEEKNKDSQRKVFAAIAGKHTPQYAPIGTPAPPGFTPLANPDVPDQIAFIPSSMRPAPKELVDGGWLPGRQAGDMTPTDELSEAQKMYSQAKIESIRAGEKAPNEYADFVKAHPEIKPGDMAAAYAKARQAPQQPERPPRALMIGPDGRAIEIQPGSVVPQGALTPQQTGAQNAPTTQMRNVAAQASLVHEQTPHMLSELDRLKGKLGPIVGRMNELMQGKIGMQDPDFAGFRADLLMYSSAVALMHARGRLPENLREEFDKAINNPGQDFMNLKAIITRIDSWTAQNIKAMGARDLGSGGMDGSGGQATHRYNPQTKKIEVIQPNAQ